MSMCYVLNNFFYFASRRNIELGSKTSTCDCLPSDHFKNEPYVELNIQNENEKRTDEERGMQGSERETEYDHKVQYSLVNGDDAVDVMQTDTFYNFYNFHYWFVNSSV